ncbi:MAG: DUF2207 domain-containing protein [Candidatus Paceibacterota bacterium]
MQSLYSKIYIAVVVGLCALPSFVYAEVIRSFDTDIVVSSDGSFVVTETIKYDFESEERHGIHLTIPTDHLHESTNVLKHRYVEVELRSVVMDGDEVPYEHTGDLGEFKIRIGDPDVTITGLHTYQIEYRVRGGLSYYDEHAELYWNVIGNEWEVPIESATARVRGAELLGEQVSCYVGSEGDREECEIVRTDEGVTFAAADLNAGEGLTLAQALVGVDQLILERLSLLLPWLLLGLVWLVALSIFVYRFITTHRSRRTVIAQYEPYEDLKPMYAGLLMDGRLDAQDITAGIVYLAEQGFFKIAHTDRKILWLFNADDYKITLQRPYSELATPFQEEIFTLLFAKDAVVGETVSLHDLSKDTGRQKENYKTVERLQSAARTDLIEQGYYERSHRTLFMIGGGTTGMLILLVSLSILMGATVLSVVLPAIGIFIGTVIALSLAWRRRTKKGYEARDHLRGFKEFLSVTDTERFKFHNAPQKSPEQFMAYLPYAIAFGVEKEWAEAFKDITIPQPDWYDGHGAAFNAVYLTNSVSAFSTAFASSSGSSPASSGGGFSGGGAGGGGGGSW